MPKTKENVKSRLSKNEIIAFVIMGVLLVYIIVLHVQVSKLKTALGDTNDLIQGNQGGQLLSIQDDIKILKTNVNSCSTVYNCEILFRDKSYQCPAGFEAACENHLCVCR